MPLPTQYQTAIKVAEIMAAKKRASKYEQKRCSTHERIYQEFEGENATWWNFDPRVEWLLGF